MDFSNALQARVIRANDALRRFIEPQPFQNTPLVEAMHYGALLGGKRLRPFLVYATGNMFGISDNTLDAPAAAVECIHAYSLIHDDLPAMDDDDLVAVSQPAISNLAKRMPFWRVMRCKLWPSPF